jgi:propanol-preferring alcohol dehydrogenase
MRALILERHESISNNPLRTSEVPVPELKDDEILLRVSFCGICHTDLHVIEGELKEGKMPVIPGHQIVGRVVEIGRNVQRFRKGDRAGIPWLYFTCGKCRFCKGGQENLCPEAEFTGYTVDGGYAEYVKVPQNFAYSLPESISDEHVAPLLCAGVIGYRAYRLTGAKEGDVLGLFGFGASAHIVIQIAKYLKQRVFVFSRSKDHRRLAERLGADWTGGAEDKPPELLNSAIIFAPSGKLVYDALVKLDRGGTLVLAGIHMSPIPELNYNLLYYERCIKSAANSTRGDVNDLLGIAEKIPVKTEVNIFNLTEANRALKMLKEGKISGAGVLKI